MPIRFSIDYLDRPVIDGLIQRAKAGHTHIVIFGLPGVGKTELVEKHFPPETYSLIQCGEKQQAPDLYRSILASLGCFITVERSSKRGRKLSGSIKFLGVGGEGGGDSGTETKEQAMTVDLGNIFDVINSLKRAECPEWIVLNDFHRLSFPAQRQIAYDLKYAREHSDLRFVIVGAWHDPSRFDDLAPHYDTFASVPVSPWTNEELTNLAAMIAADFSLRIDNETVAQLTVASAGCPRILGQLLLRCDALTSGPLKNKSLRSVTADVAKRAVEQFFARSFAAFREAIAEFGLMTQYAQPVTQDVEAQEPTYVLGEEEEPLPYEQRFEKLTAIIARMNDSLSFEAKMHRAFIEYLVERDWLKIGLSCSIGGFIEFAKIRLPAASALRRRDFRRIAEYFLKLQDDLLPNREGLVWDKIGRRWFLNDAKFLAFLVSLKQQNLNSLWETETLPVPTDALRTVGRVTVGRSIYR